VSAKISVVSSEVETVDSTNPAVTDTGSADVVIIGLYGKGVNISTFIKVASLCTIFEVVAMTAATEVAAVTEVVSASEVVSAIKVVAATEVVSAT